MFTYKINDDIHLSLPNPEVDAAPLFRLIDESRNELVPWLPWVLKVTSIEDERKSLVRNLQNLDASNSVNFVIWYKNLIAGSVSLKSRGSNNKKIELGYWLGSEFTGKGIMLQVIRELCTLAFTKFSVHKIEIHAATDNFASNKVAENSGFHLETTQRDSALLFDKFHDENTWSLLQNEWNGN